MKLVKKIAVLMSLSLGAVALGGPQDTGISYPEQSFEALPEAGALCDEQSQASAEHIVFVGGREVVVKEIPASMIEVIDEDGVSKDGCLGFHGPGEGDVKAVVTGLISNRRQLEVHQRGIKKQTAGKSLPG